MKHKRVKLSTGVVDVYDEVVPKHVAINVNNFLMYECAYFVGWEDRPGKDPNLYSTLPHAVTIPDELMSNLLSRPEFEKRVERLQRKKTVVNLSTASSIHHVHAHPGDELVVLYYPNLEWQDHWEGETMLFAEDGEIEMTNKYTPGRILVFDAKVPHTIRAQSADGPPFRFSISIFYEKMFEVPNLEKMNEPTTET